jgi:hypothetical protein
VERNKENQQPSTIVNINIRAPILGKERMFFGKRTSLLPFTADNSTEGADEKIPVLGYF